MPPIRLCCRTVIGAAPICARTTTWWRSATLSISVRCFSSLRIARSVPCFAAARPCDGAWPGQIGVTLGAHILLTAGDLAVLDILPDPRLCWIGILKDEACSIMRCSRSV